MIFYRTVSTAERLLLVLPMFTIVAGCQRGGNGPTQTQNAPTPTPPEEVTAVPAPAVPEPAWTPERVREFVLETDRELEKVVRTGFDSHEYRHGPYVGSCFGDAHAKAFVKFAIAQQALQRRASGKALRCYAGTYFGCKIGDYYAAAGYVASDGAMWHPVDTSPVSIVEQSADRVIAIVGEVDRENAVDGKIDYSQLMNDVYDYVETRYVIARGSDGVWRIADRQPKGEEDYPNTWQCDPGQIEIYLHSFAPVARSTHEPPPSMPTRYPSTNPPSGPFVWGQDPAPWVRLETHTATAVAGVRIAAGHCDHSGAKRVRVEFDNGTFVDVEPGGGEVRKMLDAPVTTKSATLRVLAPVGNDVPKTVCISAVRFIAP